MIWWIADPKRARAERQGVAELSEKSNWLTSIRWYFSDTGALTVDFDIEHNGEVFPLKMTYGAFHPDSPPILEPRDKARISHHQWGVGGNLCLEYRADNWESSITGAMMIESAWRLISGETAPNAEELPSAHYQSIGQRMRGQGFRFLLTPEAEKLLNAVVPGQCIEIGLAEKYHGDAWTVTVTDIGEATTLSAWPAGIKDTPKRGHALCLPDDMGLPAGTEQELTKTLETLGLTELRERAVTPGSEFDLVIMTSHQGAHYYAYDGAKARQYGRSRTIVMPVDEKRLPEDYAVLSGKSVGLVGCGSLGSKIAAMLVRSGIRDMLLVDDDILFAANLVRNELGATAIGTHKGDALKARLTDIAGKMEIKIRKVALGGQESPDSTDSVMSALAACDVVIDATANPHCFNFCASVARGSSKPLVWGEVFAGGIGGLIARVRPNCEPEPQIARNQITNWCNAHGVEAPLSTLNQRYEGVAVADAAAPLVADDAEVTIIAAHIARLAIDTLINPEESTFSAPAYVFGLRKAWMFSEPFETWPIILGKPGQWSEKFDEATKADALELFKELIPSISEDDQAQPTK